jgi:hypothetical protein
VTGKIGYATLHDDLERPASRRRFCYYAKRRDLSYEIAEPGRPYDMVVATVGADLGVWRELPRPARLILDLQDSYLALPPKNIKAMLRGTAKFALGHTKRLHFDFRALLISACRRADAILCTTEEQRQTLLEYCRNVHVVLDFQPEADGHVKSEYARGTTFHMVWDGLPENVVSFRAIAAPLRELQRRRPLAVHLVTDLEYALASTHFGMRPTRRLVREVFGMDGVYLYQWNPDMLAAISLASDLAVIPIPLEDTFFRGKPENKLIFFWRMGLPVITSATPAYDRAMAAAGLEMTCQTADDWTRLLERYMDDEAARRVAGEKGRSYASRVYATDTLLRQWDEVFASLS